jgi:hypothetical protein
LRLIASVQDRLLGEVAALRLTNAAVTWPRDGSPPRTASRQVTPARPGAFTRRMAERPTSRNPRPRKARSLRLGSAARACKRPTGARHPACVRRTPG